MEFDKKCVDQIEKSIEETGNTKLHTLLGDLSQTSPDFGLLGKEHPSIFKRAKSDLVLVLALVHHLALTKMIPFELITDMVYEFSNRFVLIEFIEKSDRKVSQLLQNNPRYYPSKEEFELIIQQKFKLLQCFHPLCDDFVIEIFSDCNDGLNKNIIIFGRNIFDKRLINFHSVYRHSLEVAET